MRAATLLLAPLAFVAVASAAPLSANTVSGCVTSYDASVDYFPDKVQSSGDWTITYSNNYKVLTNVGANESYVLYQCGTPAPTVAGIDKTFAVPISKAAIADTTAITYFELLDKLANIDYVDADTAGLVVSPCFQKEVESKGIVALSANATQKEQELSSMDFATNFMASEEKNVIVWSASLGDNVARREYIKYLAAFFNLEAVANTAAKALADNYECVSSASKSASAAAAKKPVVAFVEYQTPSDFNEQKASWQINMPRYKAQFIADIGAVAPANQTTSFATAAEFLEAVKDVEYLIDETFLGTSDYAGFLTTYGLTNSSSVAFIKNKKVYRTDRLQNDQGWTAWFESAVVLNNIVLADIASEVYPEMFPAYARTYLRNIATEAAGTIKMTTAAQCATPVTAVTCPTFSATITRPSSASSSKVGGAALAIAFVAAALVL